MKKAKENKNYRTSKGITLIPLIITVVLMMVLVGVVITNGLHSVDNVELQNFLKELQIIQKRVDVIYQEAKAGNNSFITYNEETQSFISSIGTEVSDEVEIPEVDDNTGYYLYTPANLEQLGIEGISQSVYINWATRDVVSVRGITSKGTTYYRNSSDIKPNYIETEAKNIKTVTTEQETNEDIKKLTVTGVITEDDVWVTDFTLKYKSDGENVWRIADSNYFKTAEAGKYYIQISGNGINSKEETVYLEDLQKEYQQLEYIESTGTQYIDTGYVPNENTKVSAKFQSMKTDGANFMLGARTSDQVNACYVSNDAAAFYPRFGNMPNTKTTATNSVIHTLDMSSNGVYWDGTLALEVPEVEFTSPSNFFVGCVSQGTEIKAGYARIFYLRLWDNDNLVMDLIPCYRISDNEIGMYDLVNDVFYTNEGTGNFVMGEEV